MARNIKKKKKKTPVPKLAKKEKKPWKTRKMEKGSNEQ